MLNRAVLWGAAILWIAGLAYFSLLRILPHANPGTLTHRIEHAAAFGILGLLLLPLCRNRGQQWMMVLAILCLASGLEFLQHLKFRTPYEWGDVRDDGVGLAVALLTVRSARGTSGLRSRSSGSNPES